MRHRVILFCGLIAPVFGANFSFVGTFVQDTDRRLFNFTLARPGTVVIRTWSYAGGVNSAGAQIASGGFDPSLALFDSTGLLLATNRDGGCNNVAADRLTASCWDAYVATLLPAGTYQLVLTESENTPLGPYLTDPFVYDGTGNFTAAPGTASPSGFWDFFPNRRSTSFALDVWGVDSAQLPLTPAVGALVNGASFQTGAAGPNTILTLFFHNLPGAPPVQALINGQSAETLYAGDTQLNFVVPGAAPTSGSGLLQILSGGNLLLATPLQMASASPALFTVNQSGTGQATVLNQDYSYNSSDVPAPRGSILMAYGTGFGIANPPSSDGLSNLAVAVTATVGGLPADVTFAGLAPGYTPGLQQINIRIPDDCPSGAAIPVRLQTGTFLTQLGTTIAVK